MRQVHEPPQSTQAPSPRENDRPAPGAHGNRLPVYVLISLLVVAVVVGFLWYDLRAAYHDTLTYWDSNLSNSADEQANVETLWLLERRTDTEAIARDPATIRLLEGKARGGNLVGTRQEVESEIDKMARINGFMGGAAADTECRIVAQTGVPAEAREGVQKACREAQAFGHFSIVAGYMRPARVLLNLAFPVSTAQGALPATQPSSHVSGAVVMIAEPRKTVLRFFAEKSRPDQFAETEIVWQDEGKAVSFSPRLSAMGVESVFRQPLGGNVFESRAARVQNVEFGEFIDYREVRVFGVARPIILAGASLARKVDLDQALSEFHRRLLLEMLAGSLSLLLFGSVIVAQHRHLAMRDLQEKLRQQQALRETERRYRILFESAGDAIFLIRGDTFIDCNQRALEMYRCTRDDMIGQAVIARYPQSGPDGPDPRQAALDKLRQARDGQTLHFEWRATRPNGTAFDAEITLSRLGIEGDVLLLALVRDVTDRKRAEEALRASETRFRRLMEGAPVAIGISRRGVTLYVNQKYLEMYGFQSVDEVVGHSIGEQWSPECQAMVVDRARQRSSGLIVPARYEAMGQRKDGSLFPVEVAVAMVDLSDGEASVGFLTDITERQRAQEDRQRSFEQLRALAARLQSVREEERKRLARDIHDQLGQALTAIKLDLSSLVRELPDAQSTSPSKGSPLLQLVDETIESVRRISTELRPGMLDDLGLAATVEWAEEEFAGRTGTKCLIDLPPEQIAIDSETATAVFRIFQETLTNVARHANASEVKVRLAEEDGDLTLEVHDNGKGIEEDELARADSLGILGMRERALLLGGTLTITGGPGKGTTVRIRIPQVHRA